MLDRIDAIKWRALQRRVGTRVAAVVVCTSSEAAKLGLDNVYVVPNAYASARSTVPGVASSELGNPRDRRPPQLIFVGPLTYEPNRLAVEWFVEHVLPRIRRRRPDTEFIVLGRPARTLSRHHSQGAGVTFIGTVPDVGPFYANASAAVVPLHSGGGTRLKVIEALAHAVPLVTTTFGCDGFDLKAGRDALIADEPEAFARACLTVLEDSTVRRSLIAAGLKIAGRFDAAHSIRRVSEIASGLIAGGVPTGAGPSTNGHIGL